MWRSASSCIRRASCRSTSSSRATSVTRKRRSTSRRGAQNVRTDGFTILAKPARLTAFQPHMHNRGTRQCLQAIYPPSGVGSRSDLARTETLSCANFHFAWHLQYHYAEDVQPLLPAGTILQVISWHDNSSANKYNPDPSNWVGSDSGNVLSTTCRSPGSPCTRSSRTSTYRRSRNERASGRRPTSNKRALAAFGYAADSSGQTTSGGAASSGTTVRGTRSSSSRSVARTCGSE